MAKAKASNYVGKYASVSVVFENMNTLQPVSIHVDCFKGFGDLYVLTKSGRFIISDIRNKSDLLKVQKIQRLYILDRRSNDGNKVISKNKS